MPKEFYDWRTWVGAAMGLALFYLMFWVMAIGCVAIHGVEACGL